MRPLASASSSALLRSCARQQSPAARAVALPSVAALHQQRRGKADAREVAPAGSSSFDSPFKSIKDNPTTRIPSFDNYKSKRSTNSNLVFQYFMVGSMGLLAAAGAKATVQGMCRPRSRYYRRETSTNWAMLSTLQTSSSTCPRRPTSSPKPRSKSTSLPFRSARMSVFLIAPLILLSTSLR